MRLLVVEDDENKQLQILAAIRDISPTAKIDTAQSFNSGLSKIVTASYELVLLDMTMPTYDIDADEEGGRPQTYAGREILRQMKRRGIVVPVIIVTQFDRFGEHNQIMTLEQLDEQLYQEFPRTYRGVVYYNPAHETWKHDLAAKVDGLGHSVPQC